MDYKFLSWYTQIAGATAGLISCTISYIQGKLYVLGNSYLQTGDLSLNISLCSYILLPLCILTLFLSNIKFMDTYVPNIGIDTFNTFVVVFNTIIGFIGSGKIFIISLFFFSLSIFFNYKYDEELEFEAYLRKKEISKETA